uniref:Uncharacterized protein n=1 Tax=Trichogramma kaykai TaxID=54128 RepID=A0ABD2X4H5_9HYME
MNNNDRRSIEGSHDEDGGAGNENQNGDFINANLLDKKQLEGLKSSVDWEVESQRYIIFDQFFRLIGDWKGPLSDLRNIFQLEEIERLLIDSIARWGTSEGENQAIRFIRFLVETGYKDKPKVDKDGKLMLHRRTALLCAYSKGIYPFGRELFKIYDRFDVNYIDEKSSYTHFHVACQWGCMDVVEKFLELGRVDPNLLVTTTGSSPLHVTLESDHVDPKIVEILLRHGANPNVANRAGLTPVHFVSKRPNNHGTNAHLLEMFCELANEKYKPVQINVASEAGLTPLDYAVARQCKSLTKSLLRFGADPNFTTVKGLTTLHKICSYDNLNVKLVKMLFKYKPVKVDAQDDQGYTPMHYAVNRCHQSVVELLLRNGSDPNSPNLEGSTPLHVICDNRSDDAEFLEAFLKICKDTHQKLRIEARDKKGRTPLKLAVGNILPNTVDVLLNQGAGLSSFVFPTVKQFDEINDYRKHVWCSKLLVASGLLMIVERLEKRGYELVQSDALTIMEFFTKYDLRESSDVEEPWYDEESFEIEAKKIMVKPSLSLYDLTRLRPEKAAKMLTYRHYLKLTCTKISKLSKEFRRNCAEHLCEKLARPFFRRWTLYPFWEQIVLYRLPLLCCDMMIDNLKNKDLFNICLAATKQ